MIVKGTSEIAHSNNEATVSPHLEIGPHNGEFEISQENRDETLEFDNAALINTSTYPLEEGMYLRKAPPYARFWAPTEVSPNHRF